MVFLAVEASFFSGSEALEAFGDFESKVGLANFIVFLVVFPVSRALARLTNFIDFAVVFPV